MITRRDGAILFTAGKFGVHPTSRMGNIGMAQAASNFWQRYAKRGKPEVLVGNITG
jgi:hypothetical protein